jgi:hypothetical protein
VLLTLHFHDLKYPHVFAVDDIANSEAHRAACRCGQEHRCYGGWGEPVEKLSVLPAGSQCDKS